MKKAKKILIIFIILFTIVLLVIVKYLLKNVQREKEKEEIANLYSTMEPDIFPDFTEKQNVKFIGEMKTVEQCIQNFYDTININSSKYYDRFNNKIITDNKINENILNLLSDEYIAQNNININNLENYIKKTNSQLFVVTMDMKYIKKGYIYKYVTNGILIDSDYNLKDKYYFCVNLDTSNDTYSIEPITIDIYNDENMKITMEKIDNKETNVYNSFSSGYEESIDEYFNRIKRLTLTNAEISYNLLDSDYKNKKFNDINKYEEYIKNNYDRIKSMHFASYEFKSNEKYYEYICVDDKGFYYIIKQDLNNCLNFRFTLDTYTLENQEAIQRYDNSSNQYKVGINIDKVISAINSKDFEFMYEKLDDSFKSKYFDNAQKLGEFLKSNLFEFNKVSYVKFTENGNDIYTYNLKISSYDEENKEIKDMTIIMKLLENRDFIMSFSL